MADWNSAQYLKFKAQRTQPSIDLAAGIEVENPRGIIDIGCGPGNSTRVVKDRFPEAHATGADLSDNMLEAARRDNPDCDFIRLDVGGDLSALAGRFDVVFSNACLQWVPEHRKLLPSLFSLLRKGGALAVQIPMNFEEPIHQIICRTAQSPEWSGKFKNQRIFYTLSEEEYFDILSELTDDFEIWRTVYFHRMPGIESIIEWYKGTGLRPYLDALSDNDKEKFLAEIKAQLEKECPKQENGEIIFRFPRFFFIAEKG